MTNGARRSPSGLRPLRLSLGNAPPFDVPARFIALGGTALAAGCVLIAVWADRLVAPGGWATPEALGITHVLALGFVTAVMAGVLYQMLPVILGARPARAWGARLTWWCFVVSTTVFVATLISGQDDLAPIGGVALTVVVIWIGGQVTVAALIPLLHGHRELARRAGRRYQSIGWPAYAVLVVTGVLNVGNAGMRWSHSWTVSRDAP